MYIYIYMYIHVHARDHYHFIFYDTMEVVGFAFWEGCRTFSVSIDTKHRSNKKRPSQKHAAQCRGCCEITHWPSALNESATRSFHCKQSEMTRSTHTAGTFRTRRKCTVAIRGTELPFLNGPRLPDFSSEDPIQSRSY